ncbi:hypothetical protein [Sandaracinus amylolyticus]|uniref:Lipoprotein n=1 Tax=Sandaracinus amylolyticus TaxID=927083 RepID=A0A0F6YMM8_9BACT|nr:hypothetical protein [Sandaracinus amylolyticus]AKF10888.1 hypothetical protein DB32_008037 [Sandaracinus amylolyticus]
MPSNLSRVLPSSMIALVIGCAPATFDSGVAPDEPYGDVSFEEARAICDAEAAFLEQHLPVRERIELQCAFTALALGTDSGVCETARVECITRTPVVDIDVCETALPPPTSCRATVGDYEACTSWRIRQDSRLHAFATCAVLDDATQREALDEIRTEPEPASCERMRRDCPALIGG